MGIKLIRILSREKGRDKSAFGLEMRHNAGARLVPSDLHSVVVD